MFDKACKLEDPLRPSNEIESKFVAKATCVGKGICRHATFILARP
jgi:hypothetical protein